MASLLLAALSASGHTPGETADSVWSFEPSVVLPLLLMMTA